MPDRPSCVLCHERPVDVRWRPFCSERCKMADLGQWLSDGYRIAGADSETPQQLEAPRDSDDDLEDA